MGKHRCLSCFKEYDDSYDICPECGTVKDPAPKEPVHLKPGTVVGDRYIIGLAVGSGGFGIIYKAWDMKLETVVAVKEFFASRIVIRAAGENRIIVSKKSKDEFEYRKNRFLAEARTMAKFGSHRNIPNVFEFFEENGTAYIVMELLTGDSLSDYLEDRGGKIDKAFALFIIGEIGKALISLHENGIIHRDVAPDNVFICSDDGGLKVKLLDFGAAKLEEKDDDVIDIVLKPGYSPVEQYDSTGNIGVWTDIYALGATLYVMLTGVKPEESTDRKIQDTLLSPDKIDPEIPENVSNAIMKAMAIEQHLRFKSVKDFLSAVNGEKKVVSLEKEKKQRSGKRTAGIIAALTAVIVGVFLVFNAYNNKKTEVYLEDADITVWISSEKGSDEERAVQTVIEDFRTKYENIGIQLRVIPETEYAAEIQKAADADVLPDLFESSAIAEKALEKAVDIGDILNSEQAAECLFLDQYTGYYDTFKKLPLGFELPVAYVITEGDVCIDYSGDYFSGPEDFGDRGLISADEKHRDLVEKNYDIQGMRGRDSFLDPRGSKTAVMLSSSMEMNEVRETLTGYQKKFVYPNNDQIQCNYLYEWSIGSSKENSENAAKMLLSWMLGKSYQNTLMTSIVSDGQLPVNKECLLEKFNQKSYSPVKKVYNRFKFEK